MVLALGAPGLWRVLSVVIVLKGMRDEMADRFSAEVVIAMTVSLLTVTGFSGFCMVSVSSAPGRRLMPVARRVFPLSVGICVGVTALALAVCQISGWDVSFARGLAISAGWAGWQLMRQIALADGVCILLLACEGVALAVTALAWAGSRYVGYQLDAAWSSIAFLWLAVAVVTSLLVWLDRTRAKFVEQGIGLLGKDVASVGVANLLSGGVSNIPGLLAYHAGSAGLASFLALIGGMVAPVLLVARAVVFDTVQQMFGRKGSSPVGVADARILMRSGWPAMAILGLASVVIGAILILVPNAVGKHGEWGTQQMTLWVIVITSAVTACVSQAALPSSYLLMRTNQSGDALGVNIIFCGLSVISAVMVLILMRGDASVGLYGVVLMAITTWRTLRVNAIATKATEEAEIKFQKLSQAHVLGEDA